MELRLKSTAVVILIVGLFAACSKETPGPKTESLAGVWEGTYDLTEYFKIQLAEEGQILVYTDEAAINEAASGTWTCVNNEFRATYNFYNDGPYSLAATYNKATKKLTGTWGVGSLTSGGGVFEVVKQ